MVPMLILYFISIEVNLLDISIGLIKPKFCLSTKSFRYTLD